MSKKYQLIYADPPWAFSNQNTGGSMKSSAQAKYTVTSTEDLKRLDVGSIADDNCVLVMWYVGAMPQDAIDLVKSWGFTLKNMNGFVWNKLTVNNNPFFGMGFWTRAGSESAIIAIKGKPTPVCRSVRAVGNFDPQSLDEVLAHLCYVGTYQNIRHSQKPDEFRDKCVELMGDVPRLEMFARTKTKGWDVFGNEVKGSIDIPLKPEKKTIELAPAQQLDIEDQIARENAA
ncbi:MT-A70 family methyltransferase [Shewanella xiamenensis]|uniref:MT-A70 family methyltransferase n=1 Tax=Shewanella xiamenensis TaxID=332186 RepID=UPI00313B42B5